MVFIADVIGECSESTARIANNVPGCPGRLSQSQNAKLPADCQVISEIEVQGSDPRLVPRQGHKTHRWSREPEKSGQLAADEFIGDTVGCTASAILLCDGPELHPAGAGGALPDGFAKGFDAVDGRA